MANRERLVRIFCGVTGGDPSVIEADSSPDTVKGWTSVTHVHLVLALEEEFAISLTPEDAADMLSFGLIETILKEKGVSFDAAASAR